MEEATGGKNPLEFPAHLDKTTQFEEGEFVIMTLDRLDKNTGVYAPHFPDSPSVTASFRWQN